MADDERWKAFEAVVYVKAWKRRACVVVVQQYDEQGRIKGHSTLVSTDLHLDGGQLLLAYQCRFQQEFLYRDAKQELGLEHCQAYGWSKIDFHLNASLTTVSLAKAAHHFSPGRPQDEPFSIADVRTRYVNEHLGLRIIRGCGLNPDTPIIRRVLDRVSRMGLRRA